MRFNTVWPLAKVLTKSQLRGSQRSRLLAKWFGNPIILFIADIVLLGILGALGYYVTSNLPQDFMTVIGRLVVEALIGIPTITAFMIILFGILAELSQPIQSTSADLVNWLPIAPIEYVLGSTLSLSYTYSFLLAIFVGLTLGPAIYVGYGPVLVVSALMGILSLFVGASTVELIRAVTNRISSSFYKKSGRSGIFARLSLTIIVLVIIQLTFSGRVVASVLGRLTQTMTAVWYVPVMWPSLTVESVSAQAGFAPLWYGLLSLGFMLIMFGLAVGMRRAYWVPVPVSIRLGAQPSQSSLRTFRFPGLDLAESAIVRKDLRSLTRRREMARFLAIPFVIAASLWVSVYQYGSSSQGFGSGGIFVYLFPVAIFCEILSVTSIGQEGSAIWNLYAAPLDARKVVNAKIHLTGMLGSIFTCGLLFAVCLFSKQGAGEILSLFLLGLTVVMEESALGVYVAGRFADFGETVRSRYVSVSGSLLGIMLGLAIIAITIGPSLIAEYFPSVYPAMIPPILLEIPIGLLLFVSLRNLAIRQVGCLLSEIPV